MKKILLTLILTIGCSSAFADEYTFKCLNDPGQKFFGAQDDAAAIEKVTSAGIFRDENSILYYRGCGSLANVGFLFSKGVNIDRSLILSGVMESILVEH